MGRALIKHNEKYAEFSSIVDGFVTGWMTKEEYVDYIKEEEGRKGVERINFDHFKTIEEVIYPLTVGEERARGVEQLMAMEFTEEEANRLIDQYGEPIDERKEPGENEFILNGRPCSLGYLSKFDEITMKQGISLAEQLAALVLPPRLPTMTDDYSRIDELKELSLRALIGENINKEISMKEEFMFKPSYMLINEKKQYKASTELREPVEEKPKWSLYKENEPKLSAGEHRTYEELGWVAEVEVVEDLSDETEERYKLKVVKTIEEAGPLGMESLEDGTVFEVSSLREGAAYSPWRLYKEGE